MLPSRTFARFLSYSIPSRYRVAVIGAGPAGFYTAHHLIHKSNGIPITIDFFDKLPAPYGLSRYGVAPDHPEVKNCEQYLDDLMADHGDKVRFFGNVDIGSDVSLQQLKDQYHSIVLAYGCTSSDKGLNVPGAKLPGVISARQFVNWYNSYPSSHSPPPLENIEDVTIIGNGNVAIDVARVLLKDPEEWAPTDISTEAVDLLKKSSVKRVNIVARRGLLQSAFTNKEIRELVELSNNLKVLLVPIDKEHMNSIRPNAKLLGRVEKRKFALLDKASQSVSANEPAEGSKRWALEFLKKPSEFVVNKEDPNLLSEAVFEKVTLHTDDLTGETTYRDAGETVSIKSDLVILSIGYEGSALKGFDEVGLAFDAKSNCLSNNEGRLLKSGKIGADNEHNFAYNHGWYTSGWIKHGPRGVIATTMIESFDTADKILEDLTNGVSNLPEKEDITKILPTHSINWKGWTRLNEYEIEQGKKLGKTRNKVQDVAEMVSVASS